MAWVVFLRGVNVGGHKTFRPSLVATELAKLHVVNVGAAGTFVVRKPIGLGALRAEVSRRLPFAADVMICPARDVRDLGSPDPFRRAASRRDVTCYVSILARPPRKRPRLPLRQPPGEEWQVQVIGVRGRFVLSLHRRAGRTLLYPNQVVETHFGGSATTRSWNTVRAICDVLEAG